MIHLILIGNIFMLFTTSSRYSLIECSFRYFHMVFPFLFPSFPTWYSFHKERMVMAPWNFDTFEFENPQCNQ